MNCKVCEKVRETGQATEALGICAMRPDTHEVNEQGVTIGVGFVRGLLQEERERLDALMAEERRRHAPGV